MAENGRHPINWSALAAIPIAIAVISVIFSAGARISRLEASVERLSTLGTDARVVRLEAMVEEHERLFVRIYERQLELDRRMQRDGPQ